ncbi:MAG: lysine--tRNA ligase [Bdellovibrionales bacterium]|nr:lysine--tRNA ligase [Bdellovibrionales bacterium]
MPHDQSHLAKNLNEQEIVRREKLQKLTQAGIHPYPERFEMTHELHEARALADGTPNVQVAGRITAIRRMGKLSFITIQDLQGKLQLCMKIDDVGEAKYQQYVDFVDIGDFFGAKGDMFTTRVGEKTLQVKEYTFLGKCLRPLPEKFHGLQDIEIKYRQRYLDLITSEETRARFLLRSKLVREMRNFFEEHNFIEVETASLQPNASGALAKPFKTHHNALGADFYLRIAPETYLKRLIVGGFHHVVEFARCYRNEGISPNHLQEFTMVEGYSAYWNFEDNMKFFQKLFSTVFQKVLGTTKVKLKADPNSPEVEVDFGGEWSVVTFRDLLLKDCGIDIDQHKTARELLAAIKDKRIDLEEEAPEKLGRGNLIDILYKRVSRPKMLGPTFLTQHPIDLSPLARANDKDQQITDRFQLVVNGAEIVNAYSELVDPIEQMKRLEEQAKLNAGGDEDAMVMDHDYVLSMEYGMPPISGWGIGIDRLIQFVTNSENIKDCVLFPLTRKAAGDSADVPGESDQTDFDPKI